MRAEAIEQEKRIKASMPEVQYAALQTLRAQGGASINWSHTPGSILHFRRHQTDGSSESFVIHPDGAVTAMADALQDLKAMVAQSQETRHA